MALLAVDTKLALEICMNLFNVTGSANKRDLPCNGNLLHVLFKWDLKFIYA
jgi:hypothetical protein